MYFLFLTSEPPPDTPTAPDTAPPPATTTLGVAGGVAGGGTAPGVFLFNIFFEKSAPILDSYC